MDCLRENPRFTSLQINYGGLTDPAVLNIICRGLLDCPSVTRVSLPYWNLTSEELDLLRPAFYNTSVTSLEITNCSIQGQRSGEAFRALLVGNNTLVDLNLSEMSSSDHQFAIGLGNCLHLLQKLDLSRCRIGYTYRDYYDLTSLMLPADGLNNNTLQHLDLRQNRIRDGRQVGLVLQHCPNLKVLDLNGNDLGQLGARAMAPGLAASNLERLYLRSCGIGNDGVASLIPEGQVNTSLIRLNLGKNGIQGADGGRQVGFVLQHCPNLKELKLNDNHLGPLGAPAMAPGLAASYLESLDLSLCHIGNASLILEGQVNMTLTRLDLSHNDIEGAEGGRQVGMLLQHCPNLKVLDLSYNKLGPLGTHAMAPGLAASNLESLVLYHCDIGNDGVASLIIPESQVNTSLTSLDLRSNDVQGFEGGQQVGMLMCFCLNLKVLVLRSNKLGPLGARAMVPGLATAMHHLERLDLDDCGIARVEMARIRARLDSRR